MDMTTLAPPASAWELLADLAARGNDSTLLHNPNALARRIVEQICVHLQCPWATMLLHTSLDSILVGQGLDQAAQQRLVERRADSTLTPMIELSLQIDDISAGTVWIGVTAALESTFSAGFLTALRHQIELLASLQRRESQRMASQVDAARELFIFHENSAVLTSGLSLDALLARISENITLALRVDRCIIHLCDDIDPMTLFEAGSYSLDESDAITAARYSADQQPVIAELLVGDSSHRVIEPGGAGAGTLGFTSALLLPLRVRDAVIGLLAVGYTTREHSFTRTELSLAHTLTDQVVAAITNVRMHQAEQQRVHDLDALSALNLRLRTEQSLGETLQTILNSTREIIPSAGARISLIDPEQRQAVKVQQSGLLDQHAPDAPAQQFQISGLANWISRYRRTLRLNTLTHPPTRMTPIWFADGSVPESYLGTPILLGDQLVGIIEVFGQRTNLFSADHERLLQLVAGQAVQSVVRLRQFAQTDADLRDRVQQLAALQRISRQLTATLSLHVIFSFALEEALQATAATQAFIALRSGVEDDLRVTNADNGELIAYIALGEASEQTNYSVLAVAGYGAVGSKLTGQQLLVEGTVVGEALLAGEPQLVDDLEFDDRLNQRGPDVAATLAIPVFYEDQIVGVVNLHSDRPRAFDHDAFEFVRALTDHVALALGNARRYEEQQRQRTLLQQRAGMLRQVLDIGQALRADRSIEEVLEQIAFGIVDTAGFRRAVFNVTDDEDAATLRVVTGAGLALSELERLRGAAWPQGYVDLLFDKRFRLGRCFFVPAEVQPELDAGFDLTAITAVLDVDVADENEWHTDDTLYVPLYSTDARLLGVLSVDEPYNRMRPTIRSLEAIEVLADQAAIAIENANLLREARAQADQMRALFQVGTATVSTLSLDDLLERVYTEIVAYLGTPSFFFVASYNHSHETIRFELLKQAGETSAAYHKRVEPKAGLTASIIDSGNALIINDYEVERDMLLVQAVILETGVRSWIGIPLRSQNQVIGVLSVQSFAPYAFSKRHVRFLTTLANQLAVALENTRLFEDRERRIAELDVINDIGRITSTTLDMSVVFTQIYERLRGFLQVDAGYIYSYNTQLNQIDLALEADEDLFELIHEARTLSPGSLTEQVLRTRQPLLYNNLAIERFQSTVEPAVFGHVNKLSASWLGVPLLGNDDEIVGVMSIQSYTPNLYGEREVSFLKALASQLALGIQNVRFFSRTQEQVRQLGLLNRASSAAATTLNIPEIYQAAAEAMANAAGADQARVVLYDLDTSTSQIVAELVPSAIAAHDAIPIENNQSIAWLNQHRRPLMSIDAQHDPLFRETHALFRQLDIHSIALIPLLSGDCVVGGVGLDFTGRQRHVSEQTLELCQTVANQTVTAVEKVRLFEETERSAAALGSKVGELSTLLEAARVLSSSLRPDEVLTRLMDVVGRHLAVSTVGLWTINAERILRPAALLGIPQEIAETMAVPVGQGLTGHVASTGVALMIPDVALEGGSLYPAFNREHHLTSFLGVPVVYREQIVGVLSVMTVQQRVFSRDEQALLAGMADQAAIALENARLFSERDRRIAELTSFNQISQRLNATLDLDTLLAVVHQEIGHVLDHSDSFVGLYDAPARQLSFPIHWADGHAKPISIVMDVDDETCLSQRVILTRQSVLLRNEQEVAALSSDVAVAGERQISSWLGVPIIQGDEVYGLLNVQSYQPNAFNQEDERFLTTVAGIAATSITRAKLFTERERRLREVSVLQDIGSAITSTLNLQDVLDRLHAELGRVVDVSTSYIGLYDAATDLLSYAIVVDNGVRTSFTPLEIERGGLNRWVIRNRSPLILSTHEETRQLYLDEADWAESLETRIGPDSLTEQSFLVVPIASGDHVLGVINIQSYQQHAFDQDDLRFVTAVANQAAAAIDNARLYQERGRRIEELSTFNDIGRQFSAVPKLDDLLALIYRQTSRLLDTKNFYIGLYDEYRHGVSFPMYYHEGVLIPQEPLLESNSLSHHVIQTRKSLLIQGANQEQQLRELSITPIGTLSKSWLGTPMIANDQVIGVIGIQDYENENAYTPEDVRLLSTLASWGAVALANARLFSDQRQSLQELGVIYDMSVQLAGTLEASEIQRIVVINALELLNVPIGALTVLDDQRQAAHQFVYDYANPNQANIPFINATSELYAQLMQSDRALLVGDIAQHAQHTVDASLGVRSLIGEVIGSHEQPLGVLWLGDRQARDWQDREISLLSIIVTLSGQALKSAALFEREQMRRAAADTLRNVAERLTRVLEQDEILALLLDQIARVVPYDSAALMLRDDADDRVRIVATRGFSEERRREIEQVSFKLSDDIDLRAIVRTKRPLVLFDAQLSQDFVDVEGTEHIHGWIGAPLLFDDEVIGLLTIDSHQPGAYDDEDAQVAFTMASQGAQALRNARLFEEVRRFNSELEQRVEERTAALAELNTQLADEKQRLQAVHAITVELTASLELNETLKKTLQLAARNLGVQRGSIMLWDDKERQLICRAVLGDDGEVHAEQIPITFHSSGGLAGWVREHQQPICISDVRKDRRWVRDGERAGAVRSVVAVPLRAENVGTLGVLMLTSPRINYFTAAQEQLLLTIANEVAIVIHNAELYSLVQEYATRLSESFNQQREETVKNQAILRSLGEGVLVLDEDQHVILLNPAAEQILNVSEMNMLGQPLTVVLGNGQAQAAQVRTQTLYDVLNLGLRTLQEQNKTYQHHLELTGPAQSIELYFTPVVDPSSTLYGSVVVLRDVTREIEADRAKRDFISSVSHELRTPLTAIKGYVDLLTLGAAGPINETQGSFLGVVKNNANRLMELINDILEIGRIDANKIQLNFEPIDMRELLRDVLETMHAEIERKHMRVLLTLADGLPTVEADTRRLTQVVLNMVSNAVKYTFAEGQIELRAFLNPAGMLEVDVVDDGVGISDEQQQHLFRRFYRADNPLRDEAGGTGLGLSIARSFVELHGGEMWVKSAVGEGSTFSFIIPVAQPEQPAAALES